MSFHKGSFIYRDYYAKNTISICCQLVICALLRHLHKQIVEQFLIKCIIIYYFLIKSIAAGG